MAIKDWTCETGLKPDLNHPSSRSLQTLPSLGLPYNKQGPRADTTIP